MLDIWALYALMLKSRLFEEAVARLWQNGMISGEMHLGTGEEAVIAGVVSQLQDGDAMALDHRSTAAMLMRGVDGLLILRELLGMPNGLCGGMGGHMHLFDKEHLAASSGIVGAAGPTAAGFALSAQYLNTGGIAVAFFGDGAMNQGMLLESLNLASVWKLPVVFVCKDDGWAITTQANSMTEGDLIERARVLGVPAVEVDGLDVSSVYEASQAAIERARSGDGPSFLHAHCVHLEGHFLGFQLIRMVRDPLKEMAVTGVSLPRSFLHSGGAAFRERLAGLKFLLASLSATRNDPRRDPTNDPLRRVRAILLSEALRLQELEKQLENDINRIVSTALAEVST